MKHIPAILAAAAALVLFSGCRTNSPQEDSVSSEQPVVETMTIVKLPSPPVCKTTDKAGIIKEVRDYLAGMDKEKLDNEGSALPGGWQYMIRFNVNGTLTTYSFTGDTMTTSDGERYLVDDLATEKIQQFYNEMTESEESYTGQGN